MCPSFVPRWEAYIAEDERVAIDDLYNVGRYICTILMHDYLVPLHHFMHKFPTTILLVCHTTVDIIFMLIPLVVM